MKTYFFILLLLVFTSPFSILGSEITTDTFQRTTGIVVPYIYSYFGSLLVVFYSIPAVHETYKNERSKFPGSPESPTVVSLVARKIEELLSASSSIAIDESFVRALESSVSMKLIDQQIDFIQFINFFLSNQSSDISKLFRIITNTFNPQTGKYIGNVLSHVINVKLSVYGTSLGFRVDNSNPDNSSRIGNTLIFTEPEVLVIRPFKCTNQAASSQKYASMQNLKIEPEITINRRIYSIAAFINYSADSQYHFAIVKDFGSGHFYAYLPNGTVERIAISFISKLKFTDKKFNKALFYVKEPSLDFFTNQDSIQLAKRPHEEAGKSSCSSSENVGVTPEIMEKMRSIFKPPIHTYPFSQNRYLAICRILAEKLPKYTASKLDILAKQKFGTFALGSQPYSFCKSISYIRHYEALELILTIIVGCRDAIELVFDCGKSRSAPLLDQILAEVVAKMLLGVKLIPLDSFAFEICRQSSATVRSFFPSKIDPESMSLVLNQIMMVLNPNLFKSTKKTVIEYEGLESDDPNLVWEEEVQNPVLSFTSIAPRVSTITGLWVDCSYNKNRRRYVYKSDSIFLPVPVKRIYPTSAYKTLISAYVQDSAVYWTSSEYVVSGSLIYFDSIDDPQLSRFGARSAIIDSRWSNRFISGFPNELSSGDDQISRELNSFFAVRKSFYVFFCKCSQVDKGIMTSSMIPDELYDRIIGSIF